MNKTVYCIITTTVDDRAIADTIANRLLQQKLVACVQVSKIESIYQWKGKVEHSHEWILHMKTKCSHFDAIKSKIEVLHPYEVPEIISTPILNANDTYLNWLEKEIET